MCFPHGTREADRVDFLCFGVSSHKEVARHDEL